MQKFDVEREEGDRESERKVNLGILLVINHVQQRKPATGQGTVGRRSWQPNDRFLARPRALPPSIVPLRDGREIEARPAAAPPASRCRPPALHRPRSPGNGTGVPCPPALVPGGGGRGRIPEQAGPVHGVAAPAPSKNPRGAETAAQLHRFDRDGYTLVPREEACPVRHLSTHTGALSLLSYPWPRVEELDQAQSVVERLLREIGEKREREGPLLGDPSRQSGGFSPRRLQEAQSAEEGTKAHGFGGGRGAGQSKPAAFAGHPAPAGHARPPRRLATDDGNLDAPSSPSSSSPSAAATATATAAAANGFSESRREAILVDVSTVEEEAVRRCVAARARRPTPSDRVGSEVGQVEEVQLQRGRDARSPRGRAGRGGRGRGRGGRDECPPVAQHAVGKPRFQTRRLATDRHPTLDQSGYSGRDGPTVGRLASSESLARCEELLRGGYVEYRRADRLMDFCSAHE